jgi:hypothetical protein
MNFQNMILGDTSQGIEKEFSDRGANI